MDRPTALVPRHYVAIGGRGPEDVVADARGRVLTGVEDGRILRIDRLTEPFAARVEVIAETGGRPLGLELLPDDALLVCDAVHGLLRVGLADGIVRILVDSVAGERLRFCSNVIALSDGSVCFTVSSRRYPLEHWIGDLVEHTGTGRLLRLAPGSDTPEVLLEGLQFANGLAASGDESFLVVAETGACRLTRYWLTGPKAGDSEPFAENLPGMPDNLWRAGPDGPMWVSLAGPRVPRSTCSTAPPPPCAAPPHASPCAPPTVRPRGRVSWRSTTRAPSCTTSPAAAPASAWSPVSARPTAT